MDIPGLGSVYGRYNEILKGRSNTIEMEFSIELVYFEVVFDFLSAMKCEDNTNLV
jgi:hypothetical protein